MEAGINVSRVLSQRPFCSFPRFKTLWCGGTLTVVTPKLSVKQLPFLNVTALRTLWTGIAVVIEAVSWRCTSARGAKRIIMIYNLTEPNGVFAYLAAKLTGSHVVASLNDVFVPGVMVASSPLRKADFWLQKQLIPRLDGAVVVSASIRDSLCAGLPTLQIEGGIPEDLLSWDPKPSHSNDALSQPRFRVLLSGSLTEANGVLDVLAALAKCEIPNIELFVAGRGPLADRVRDAAFQDSRIVYLGFLDRGSLLECYKRMDLLLNIRITQRIKTDFFFPSKLVEIIATGLPVLTTDVGGFLEHFREDVFMLKDETPLALVAKLEQIAAQPQEQRLAMGRAARDKAIASLTWSAQGLKLAGFLRDLRSIE